MEKLKRLQEQFRTKMARLQEIRKLEGEALTDAIRAERDALLAECDGIAKDIETEQRMIDLEKRNGPDGGDNPGQGSNIVVEDQPIYRGSAAAVLGQQAVDVAIVTARSQMTGIGRKDIESAESRLQQNTKRALQLIEKRQGQKPSKEFEDRSMAPIFNPEARAAGTGMVQGAQADGGFLLQSETSIDLMTHGFNNSAVLSRCQKRTLTGSESLEIVMIKETSRADGSRGGGVRVYTDAELDQMTSSKTIFEKVRLAPERLTGLYYASDKILMNAVMLGQEMRQLFMEEFAFKGQDLVMNGTGAGQAQGIAVAPCTIEIDKESGQGADTIVVQNILKMFQRFYLRGGGSPVWLANRNTFTELMTLTYDIGTGGELAKLYIPPSQPGGTGSMLGYPVEFVEQAETLGDDGDIRLCDLSQYLVVDYGDVNEASSIHFKFDYNQTTFRFVYYFDGQPRVRSAITPYKGTSDTLSPFIEIADRA